ncbi:translation elongation factor 2 (EF-2/EF-G) [Plasticicumulans lactativorans]|uniref:Elongation factor G n=1 Tax=Plasticicumulans lactativorans TaxID=1133106 RepID=A0A4R2KWT6_9GAMM|nr:elongation factor G [Plasticicumulans lactativorans]TCO77327.1 translation elongation factor 2 (EF-2/EF-G) [Plasticicumulans lactativorans]
MAHSTHDIRNIALVGHAASGKTTLTEALLLAAGRIPSAGTVEKGSTVTDFDTLEKAHGHSLDAALVNFDWDGCHVNLIDTPGFPDVLGQAVAVLPAVETAAVVVNAQAGIESVTVRMMERAAERGLCRLLVVNRIDAEGVDLPGLLAALQDTFGRECLPINLPARAATAVVDCFFNPAGDSDFSSVADAHTALIDQVVEVDEALMALYLEQGEELAPEQLHAPFEQALREGHLIPVCFVSARSGAGVRELLDVFARLAPSPSEGNPPAFLIGEGDAAQPYAVAPDPAQHVVAHVFKVLIDPFVGKLALMRVHQGTLTPASQLFIGDARKPFKVGHLFALFGREHPEITGAVPGDICAVAKVDDIHRDAVLHDSHDEDYLHLAPSHFPVPLAGLAIAARTRNDEQRLADTLHKLLEEDPCLALEHNPATRETVLRGLSELHLRVTLEKMKERYRLEVDTRPPRIAYRETISSSAEGHHRHKKQTGGAGQFGEVYLRIEPLARGEGFAFVDAVVGGVIPGQFIPAVEKGVREALATGAIAGYPLQDLRVTVYDGKHHPVDSKEVAFATAGREAFLAAVRAAGPKVLEPIVNLDVQIPQEAVGTITGDLSGRRGRILGTRMLARGRVAVSAQAPLGELDDYPSMLKAMTSGSGSYTLEFAHYEVVPPNLQKALCAQYKPTAGEDA